MYAIVEIAGQQFKVEKGQQIFVNRLHEERKGYQTSNGHRQYLSKIQIENITE